jgi:D-alanyl-D-alanine carboxypeptidase
VVFALLFVAVPVARAQAGAPLAAKASILVDADTGNVLDGVNVHQPLPPASLSKIFTALAAVHALEPGTAVPVSARAAGMPAHNLNMKAGQVWTVEDVLGSLLVSSANDAAMALAERVAGTAEGFVDVLGATSSRLGLADQPTLQDPSGLDDNFSIGGGNKVSARDLAIASRAVLAEPRLASLVSTPVYSFTGGDGIAHRLGNHNRMLKVYRGSVGVKTGYTKRSMHSLAAAATRDGRTMIAVIIGAPGDTYTLASNLLDKGFGTPVASESTADRLPAVPSGAVQSAVTTVPARTTVAVNPKVSPAAAAAAASVVPNTVNASASHAGGGGSSWLGAVGGFTFRTIVMLLVAVLILRVRAVMRQRNRQATATRTKTYRVPPRSRAIPATIDLADSAPVPSAPVRAARTPRPPRPLRVAKAKPSQATLVTAPMKTIRPRASAPKHARPVVPPAHRRSRPLVAVERVKHPEEVAIDPRLAKRFEILVRTGQVVP